MGRTIATAAGAALVLLGSVGVAQAQETQRFGGAGTLSFSTDYTLATFPTGVGNVIGLPLPTSMLTIGGSSTTNNGGSSFGFSLAPAADYFVIDGLSLGGEVLFGYFSVTPGTPACAAPPCPSPSSQSITLYGVGPRVGYNIAFSDLFSFWPKVSFDYVGFSVSNNGGSGSVGELGVYAPFLLHPVPHFYFGFGPDFATELFVSESVGNVSVNNPPKTTSYGAFLIIGGWLKLGG